MFNDTSTPLTLLQTRRSGKARDLVAPGPDAAQFDAICAIAARVPDHGKLAPWRIVEIAADRRDAFAGLLTSTYRAERPEAGRLEIEAMEAFARQAPVLVAIVSTPVAGSKIPLWEQQASCGAMIMQMLNAAHAMGFAGNWLSGWPAESPAVARALGCSGPDDRVYGYVFIGTAAKPLEERPRPILSQIVHKW